MSRAFMIPRPPTTYSPANDEMVAGYLDGFNLGVDKGTIAGIKRGKTWRSL